MIAGAAAILILFMLGCMHVYWAAGGIAGKAAAIPTLDGRPVLRPGVFATTVVAAVLFAMAGILALRIAWPELLAVLIRPATWLIAAVFLLRAIGDFRYVGFFKRIRHSRFAHLDTFVYAPFCAVLAILSAIAAGRVP